MSSGSKVYMVQDNTVPVIELHGDGTCTVLALDGNMQFVDPKVCPAVWASDARLSYALEAGRKEIASPCQNQLDAVEGAIGIGVGLVLALILTFIFTREWKRLT